VRLRLANQVAAELRKYFGDKVFNTLIQRNVRISEAPSFGRPVLLYDATSVGSRNYIALAREVLSRQLQGQDPAPSDLGTLSTGDGHL
jgi:chromosome partitioning protein